MQLSCLLTKSAILVHSVGPESTESYSSSCYNCYMLVVKSEFTISNTHTPSVSKQRT